MKSQSLKLGFYVSTEGLDGDVQHENFTVPTKMTVGALRSLLATMRGCEPTAVELGTLARSEMLRNDSDSIESVGLQDGDIVMVTIRHIQKEEAAPTVKKEEKKRRSSIVMINPAATASPTISPRAKSPLSSSSSNNSRPATPGTPD